MPFEIDFTGMDDATKTLLQSEAVKTALDAAYKKAHDADEKPLRDTRDSLLTQERTLKAKIKEFEDAGGLEALKKLPELDTGLKKKDSEVTAKDEQVRQLQERLDKMQHLATSEKVSARLSQEIRDAKGSPELLEHVVKSRIKHTLDENGNLQVSVLNKEGEEYYVNGAKATVKDLLSELKASTSYARAFDAVEVSGSGAKPGNSSHSATNPFAKATMNSTEQSRLIKTDRARAIQLANAAGVKLDGLNAA